MNQMLLKHHYSFSRKFAISNKLIIIHEKHLTEIIFEFFLQFKKQCKTRHFLFPFKRNVSIASEHAADTAIR